MHLQFLFPFLGLMYVRVCECVSLVTAGMITLLVAFVVVLRLVGVTPSQPSISPTNFPHCQVPACFIICLNIEPSDYRLPIPDSRLSTGDWRLPTLGPELYSPLIDTRSPHGALIAFCSMIT